MAEDFEQIRPSSSPILKRWGSDLELNSTPKMAVFQIWGSDLELATPPAAVFDSLGSSWTAARDLLPALDSASSTTSSDLGSYREAARQIMFLEPRSGDEMFDPKTPSREDRSDGASTNPMSSPESQNAWQPESKQHNPNQNQRGPSERMMDITLEQLSQYFNMPIIQASKELKVGLTVLKKRCREFGIPRWPHRKLKSLESLINKSQELARDSEGRPPNPVIHAVEELEKQRKIMEKSPGIELDERTKRFRQAIFKASYKQRRRAIAKLEKYRNSDIGDQNQHRQKYTVAR